MLLTEAVQVHSQSVIAASRLQETLQTSQNIKIHSLKTYFKTRFPLVPDISPSTLYTLKIWQRDLHKPFPFPRQTVIQAMDHDTYFKWLASKVSSYSLNEIKTEILTQLERSPDLHPYVAFLSARHKIDPLIDKAVSLQINDILKIEDQKKQLKNFVSELPDHEDLASWIEVAKRMQGLADSEEAAFSRHSYSELRKMIIRHDPLLKSVFNISWGPDILENSNLSRLLYSIASRIEHPLEAHELLRFASLIDHLRLGLVNPSGIPSYEIIRAWYLGQPDDIHREKAIESAVNFLSR